MKQLILFLLSAIFSNAFSQNMVTITYPESKLPIFAVPYDSSNLVYEDHLQLFTINNGKRASFPVTGTYRLNNDIVEFQPNFPLSYTAEFIVQVNDTTLNYKLPREHTVKTYTNVRKFYPGSTSIPSNILSFYIEFDSAMAPTPNAYEHVKLISKNGREIEHPWREKSYWINNNRTLVLMVHPGRVKHGIQSTYNLEPIFVEGEHYQIEVSNALLSNQNEAPHPLYRIRYNITAPDTISPKIAAFSNEDIQTGTQNPLTFSFNEVMDYGLVYKWVKIYLDSHEIEGTVNSTDGISWTFTPEKNWIPGDYTLQISSKVGDPSHNQLDRLFEISTETDFNRVTNKTFEFSISK